MNEKTAKLIKKYSAETGGNYTALKREWLTLDRAQRTDRRKEMKKALEE